MGIRFQNLINVVGYKQSSFILIPTISFDFRKYPSGFWFCLFLLFGFWNIGFRIYVGFKYKINE